MSVEYERRQDRIEDAIEKLTSISMDLKQIIAVHEQRISQQEKHVSAIFKTIETRRTEIDQQIRDVYESLEKTEKRIEDDTREQVSFIKNRLNELEKYIWMAMGAGIVISWILTNGIKFIK
jgi:predicted  nucleic acid-binding Zn-ribbon protein